ncbi:hypothetical protein [Cellulomonas sp. URHD0024]|uniref:hypothetical protein n=1 Tax=Cellulomonas sp. URHD0024 TaxID=1302620 RepID=UPI00040D92F1|nr:hypothetical protein [Cellulomonas sp. URHD0024]
MSVVADISALETAAAELRSAGEAVRAADVAGPFAPIGDALAGSATAEAAVWVSTRLGAAVQVFGEDVAGMAASATGSASAYRSTDSGVGRRFGTLAGPR